MQEDDVEDNQEPSGDQNRDQTGASEVQVEGEAVQASAQRVQRVAETV